MRSEDEIIEDYKYYWVGYLNEPVYFKEEYLGNRPIDDFYFDQAPYYNSFYNRTISSVFLKLGLQRMEYWMFKQITGNSEYTKDELDEMIKRNPHLHNVIKTNLLDNLNNTK